MTFIAMEGEVTGIGVRTEGGVPVVYAKKLIGENVGEEAVIEKFLVNNGKLYQEKQGIPDPKATILCIDNTDPGSTMKTVG